MAIIAKRHVFHLAGYDPIDVAGQHRRFRRELARFAGTWGLSCEASEVRQEGAFASWTAVTRAPNWVAETVYEPLDWHDIVVADMALPDRHLLVQGFLAFFDFIGTGTLFRYFSASHRYAFFFFVPFFYVFLFAVAAAVCGYLVGEAIAIPYGGALVGAVTAIGAFALLMRWMGPRLRVGQGLADWMFARDYMRGRRADVDARIDAFADRIVARVRQSPADEILFVGHSFGAILLIDVMARALARAPDLARTPISLLTVGATIPKLTLHPAAARLRACAERLAVEPSIFWAEYQSRDDAISFYKFHPVELRPLRSAGETSPHIRRVQFHEMMSPATFRRYRLHFMRLHYQFVMANDRRAAYDYFMLVCGPLPLKQIAFAPKGPVDSIASDGSLLAVEPARV